MAESLGNKSTSKPFVDDVTDPDDIDAATFRAMLDILDNLTNHTHIFYDDYSTACNCNCNCDCTRGIV